MASYHQVSNGKAETAAEIPPATDHKSLPEDDSGSCKQAEVQCEDAAELTDSMCEDDFGADDDHFSELGEGLDTEVRRYACHAALIAEYMIACAAFMRATILKHTVLLLACLLLSSSSRLC